ncbi:hypothetical protein [Natronococcus sp. A-GB7]|uniref:hypothetical protein n=1 Tax=Natronococcus sp. A-GB7 TaxID=3037649 RepID=UPI00241C1D69|nr:hypothetical protein [Natronococcus sp. A-GB7]MDG5821548.1 hypothetical protein [Natronococcus sp. A-GB7]
MSNDDSRDKNRCPTERRTAGQPEGRDATTDIDRLLKMLPRLQAAAWTGDRTGAQSRPVERSTTDANNPVDDSIEEVLIARPMMEAGSDE